MKPIRRILMATDFSACARDAALVAAQLARQLNAAIDVLTVVDTSPLAEAYGDASFRAARIAEIHTGAGATAEEFARRQCPDCKEVGVHVRDGNPFLEIIEGARELGSDLIVLGTHGRTGLTHLIMGSVAERVVRKSPIPVVTVRGSA